MDTFDRAVLGVLLMTCIVLLAVLGGRVGAVREALHELAAHEARAPVDQRGTLPPGWYEALDAGTVETKPGLPSFFVAPRGQVESFILNPGGEESTYMHRIESWTDRGPRCHVDCVDGGVLLSPKECVVRFYDTHLCMP